jgi:NTE family protein
VQYLNSHAGQITVPSDAMRAGKTTTVRGRALVLGSGGITGVAWEVGLLAGLAAQGLDLSGADLVIGTSAGSLAGAQLTSGIPLAELYQAQLAPDGVEVHAGMTRELVLRYALAFALPGTRRRARIRMGKISLASPDLPEDERRAVIGAWLPRHEWPSQRLLIIAVDTGSGEWTAFDSASGAGLIEAVSASCAVPGVWPPVQINGRRWMDGGMRSGTNADLAAECAQIVVLAPLWRGFGLMTGAARQCRRLARRGQRSVALVVPDQAAQAAIGPNLLDSARRALAAQAGYAQAATVASQIAAVWSGGERVSPVSPS